MKMRYDKCRCGNDKFELNRKGKLECKKCGQWWYPFSPEEIKVDKAKGFYWIIISPQFMESMSDYQRIINRSTDEPYLPEIGDDDLIEHFKCIEKSYDVWPKVRVPTQAAKWMDMHIYWTYRYNPKRRRVELNIINMTKPDRLTCRFHNKVEFVKVNFNE